MSGRGRLTPLLTFTRPWMSQMTEAMLPAMPMSQPMPAKPSQIETSAAKMSSSRPWLQW